MRRVYLGAMVGALVSLAFAPPALAADRVEPLNQYIVKGTDAELGSLGALGYDVTEGATRPAGPGIVATPGAGDALEAKGFDVTPLGKENTATAPARRRGHPARRSDLGLRRLPAVRLKPAPCQTTCSGAVDADGQPVSIKQYRTRRGRQPDARQARRLRHVGQRAGARRLQGHRRTRTRRADGSSPAAMFHGAQHAREWISVEVTRREFKYVLDHKTDAGMRPGAAGVHRAVVHPGLQRRRLRLHVPVARHAPVAQEPARHQRQRHDRDRRRHRHQPQLLREVALRQRGRVGLDRRATPTAARRRSPSPRSRASTT